MKENSNEQKVNLLKKLNPKIIIPIAGGLLLTGLVLITLAAFAGGDNIRGGVSVNGIDVGGMSRQEAYEAVSAVTNNALEAETITVSFKDTKSEIAFSDLIRGYSVDAAIDEAIAVAHAGNFISDGFKSIILKLNPRKIIVEPEYDEDLITGLINSYAAGIEDPLVESIYEVEDDKLRMVNGKAGYVIDSDTAMMDIKTVLSSCKSGNITITQIKKGPAIFDEEEIYLKVALPPVNAELKEENGKKLLVKAKNGYDFDKTALVKFIKENKENKEAYYFDLTIIEPENTSVPTDGLFEEVLAKYTSKITDSNRDRLNNVQLAAEKINGIIVNPGEEFRYLPVVEPITIAGGYRIANVYSNGKVTQDIGGGVCQVSSALYTATLYADLEITKRFNHSLTVAYVPLGQDATVSSGELDFRFINNTNEPLKIQTQFSPTGITAIILGKKPDKSIDIELENVILSTNHYETEITEDPSLQPGEVVTDVNGKTGYVVNTYKNYYKDGELLERKHVSKSVYRTVTCKQRKGPETAETLAPPALVEGEMVTAEETVAPTPAPEATPTPEGSPVPEAAPLPAETE